MTKYGEADWIGKATERKRVRDEERTRFNAAVGIEPHHSVDELLIAPQQQLVAVLRLMQITRDAGVEPENIAAMAVMAKSLAAVRLGRGPMGSIGEVIQSIHTFSSRELLDFFIHDYNHRDG
jgi:hypothetical protein